MNDTARTFDLLRTAKADGSLVLIGRRHLEPESAYRAAYVIDVSETLVLLSTVSDRIDLDGYEVLRLADITSCRSDFRRRAFYEKALAVKRCEPEAPYPIDLRDIATAMRSIDAQYPLLVIARERVAPDEVAIGRLKAALATGVRLRWITPDAAWDEDRTLYRYSSITRLAFDGEYENTLALVAGIRPPPLPADAPDDRLR